MNRSSRAFRFAAGAVLALVLAVPSFAQSRQRLVTRANTTAASLSGTVIDAVTRAPLADAVVKVGKKTFKTGADGKFTFDNLTANTYPVKTTRWGYADRQQDVPLAAGVNQVEIALQPGPIVTVKAKNGTTYPLDSESVRFGFITSFVGWTRWAELHLCSPAGTESVVTNAEMRSVRFPGVRTESTSCCALAPGTIARVTKTDGTVVEGTIKESCTGPEFYVTGRNRSTGAFENLKLADVESVTFP